MFGVGVDLCISDECYERFEFYFNLFYFYDGFQVLCSFFMGEYNFIVKDYEVFGLKIEFLYERV